MEGSVGSSLRNLPLKLWEIKLEVGKKIGIWECLCSKEEEDRITYGKYHDELWRNEFKSFICPFCKNYSKICILDNAVYDFWYFFYDTSVVMNICYFTVLLKDIETAPFQNITA